MAGGSILFLRFKRKRKRSVSVLWQKPLHPQKIPKSNDECDNMKTPPKTSITQWLRTDLGRSVGVMTATQLVWLNGVKTIAPYAIKDEENIVTFFMPPAWKVRHGHLVIGSSVCLSHLYVCLLFRPTNKVQYLKFGWSFSNKTWTVSSSLGSSHLTDITCPWGWAGSKCKTEIFCLILTLLLPGASWFH